MTTYYTTNAYSYSYYVSPSDAEVIRKLRQTLKSMLKLAEMKYEKKLKELEEIYDKVLGTLVKKDKDEEMKRLSEEIERFSKEVEAPVKVELEDA